jgi:leucine dehydrogenase
LKTGVFDIRIADPDKKRLDEVCRGRREIKIVDLETIHRQEVDVFIPCALGGSLNKEAIGGLVCSGVAGCENNQLAKPEDGESLHRLGIRYAPDFVINGGGLIKVFTEIIKDRCEKIMLPRIGKNLHEIFIRSEEEDRATSIIAEEIVKGRVEQAMSIPR